MTPPFPTRRSSDLVRLSDHDVDLLEGALRSARDDLHRVQLHFALGKALGDLSRSELSFRQYQKANDIRRKLAPYSAMDGVVRQTEAIFTPEFLAGRKDLGRSEERRVGKECVSPCISRWSPYHYKKKNY